MQVLNECPAVLQFIFWVAAVAGVGYTGRILNKMVHKRHRRPNPRVVARERQ